ncbi:MAG: Uma2 family endonuclease [Solirubrobacterales bacterium]|nr:Uma2 family endonuclease [Solirubrobacterales bacterium]
MAVAAAPIHRLTVEQVFAMQEAGLLEEARRTELVDGILYDVIPPNAPHSDTVAALNRHLTRALPDAMEALIQDAIFVHGGYLSPDLFVAPLEDRGERRTRALLAIEVTHTTHRRDRQKATEYAAASVPEYWMVDLVALEVVVHRKPAAGAYTEISHHRDGTLPIPGGGAPVDVAALLARSTT